MSVLIHDPARTPPPRADRPPSDADRWNEVWDGVLVVPPLPNNEHQDIVGELYWAFRSVIDRAAGDRAQPGANVSDQDDDWTHNFRCPDLVVYRAGGRAEDRGTHWFGGPDLVVEIASPGQDSGAKLAFYAAVGCREVLVIERDPWAVELFRLAGGAFASVGRADGVTTAVLASVVLPLTFQLRPAAPRPAVVMTHAATGQTWTA